MNLRHRRSSRSLLLLASAVVGLCSLLQPVTARAAGCSEVESHCPVFGYYTLDASWSPATMAGHSNVVYRSVHMNDPAGTLATLQAVKDAGLRAVLAHPIIFQDLNATRTGLNNEAQWTAWVNAVNNSNLVDTIAALYVVDEPYHNGRLRGMSDAEIRQGLETMVARYKAAWNKPVAMVEAYPVVQENASSFIIPSQLDWVGFDCYAGYESCHGISVPEYFRRLSSKMSGSQQLLMVLPGVLWAPTNATPGETEQAWLRQLADKYLQLYRNPAAESIPRPFKGMLTFAWANAYLEGQGWWHPVSTFSEQTREHFAGVGRAVLGTQGASGCNEHVWVEDALPAGAIAEANSDAWTWTGDPRYSGTLAHESSIQSGMHQHYFHGASQTLSVGTGDTLFTYVYLDPNNPPQTVMLQWNDGSWEHRAYWGANFLAWGVDGTESRRPMGALPAAGQWVRLAVSAADVGLEGKVINGMAFTLHGGRAYFDRAGRAGGSCSVGTSVGGGYTRVDFDATSTRRATGTGDWMPGSHKAECGAGERVVGVSKYSSPPYKAHGALCAPSTTAASPHNSCRTYVFANGDARGTSATGDWATNYYKGECAADEYMAGVSQTPDGKLDAILCCKGAVTHNNCTAPIFLAADARESTATGEWDPGYWKGECGAGKYAAGISRQVDAWWSGFSLLCCAP